MKLEIEKDIEAFVRDGPHVVRTVGGEHLEADLYPAERTAELAEQWCGGFAGRDVEGEDKIAGHRGE